MNHKDTMRRNSVLIYLIIFVTIVVISITGVWRYFNHPLAQAQIILMTTQGAGASTEFFLPRGSYIVKAVLEEELLNNDTSRRIIYKVSVPAEGINLSEEANINFSNKVKEVWLKSFEIKDNNGHGVLGAEVITTTKPVIKIKILAIKQVLFRTVE